MASPRVSVIVPAWHAEATIGRAVHSLLAQSLPDWEAVVAADDDRDYRAILAGEGIADVRIRHVRTPRPRSGAPAARNAAWAAASGGVAAPLDADDVWLPGRLERLLPIAEARGAAADNVRVVEEATGTPIGHLFPEDGPDRVLDADAFLATSVPIMALVRRDAMTGWDADVDLCDDLPFNLRAIDRSGGLFVTAASFHEYRVRDGSICHSPDSDRRADRGYATCLARLATDGLGIRDPSIRETFRLALEAKRALNRAYAEWRARRPEGGTFQQFIAETDGRRP
ncbi:glycosyltransferase family 2 protein [Stella sp.]|uniref:glycosyltransferase family 2 protein n=1 Tax=Stella sp. TaxID=2912054 RepID=UPI0035B36452